MLSTLSFPRRVEPELLDTLPAADAGAIRSRADLRRINRVMGARSILCRAIDDATLGAPPRRIVELGGGDGTLLLRIAERYRHAWTGVEATLVDRQDVVGAATRENFARLGWTLRVVAQDVFDWLDDAPESPLPRHDLALANLFLHHFTGDALARLLHGIAGRATAFVACEPRRAPAALFASRLVGGLGCNAVTRSDAVASVRAGFRDTELMALWPQSACWRIDERPAGAFSHCFAASLVREPR